MEKVILSILGIALIVSSCSGTIKKKGPNNLVYNNIAIYSDLSNRLNDQPNDSLIIKNLLEYFKEECVKPGIKINDRSSISFSKLNHFNSDCNSARIDLNKYNDDLNFKQKFVNNKSESDNLNTAMNNFLDVVHCNYSYRDNSGLDILSLLALEVTNSNCIKKNDQIFSRTDTTNIIYNNHLILFTDGYLEFNRKKGNRSLYFGQNEIEKIRKYCEQNQINDPSEVLTNEDGFNLPPLYNENNAFINLYVLETGDRGFDPKKGTLKNSGPLSDNNILKAVWIDWALKSGFKNIVWKAKTSNNIITRSFIKNLLIN